MTFRIAALSLFLFGVGCSANAGFYEGCESTDECGGAALCYTIAFEAGRSGQMCTDTCETNAECPFGGACFELLGDPRVGQRVCYERCRDSLDCPRGFLCADAENSEGVVIDAICLPE